MNLYNLGFVATEVILLVVGKYLLNTGIHPYFYALVTGVVAAVIIWQLKKVKPHLPALITSLPTILFFTIANTLGFAAIKFTTLTNYNFIIQSSLLIMPLTAWLILGEKIRPLIFPLALINLTGIALLSGGRLLPLHFNGDLLALAAAVFVSLDFVWQKKAALKINQDEVAFWRRLISSLALGIFWLLTPTFGRADWQSGLLLIPISLFYVSMSLLMVRCLRIQPVADFNLFITLSPVLTALAAFLWLGETMNQTQFWGAGLILASILVYNWLSKAYDLGHRPRPQRV
ncbi:MAG TPA: DMT family transporter [Patescibacteria group bacterium]|nr:DMT family transporter [Patescibacteria group bacterium]